MMTQAPAGSVNELFFSGGGDPRHKCVAIGYHNNTPVVYKFETVDLPQGTSTTVRFARSLSPTCRSLTPHLHAAHATVCRWADDVQ